MQTRRARWGAVTLGVAMLVGCAHAPLAEEQETQEVFRIGREDVLDVAVWRDPDLSRTVPVRPDGKISLPLLGDVEVEGRTPHELARYLEEALGPYVQKPRVSVIVREVNSARVYVTGRGRAAGRLRAARPDVAGAGHRAGGRVLRLRGSRGHPGDPPGRQAGHDRALQRSGRRRRATPGDAPASGRHGGRSVGEEGRRPEGSSCGAGPAWAGDASGEEGRWARDGQDHEDRAAARAGVPLALLLLPRPPRSAADRWSPGLRLSAEERYDDDLLLRGDDGRHRSADDQADAADDPRRQEPHLGARCLVRTGLLPAPRLGNADHRSPAGARAHAALQSPAQPRGRRTTLVRERSHEPAAHGHGALAGAGALRRLGARRLLGGEPSLDPARGLPLRGDADRGGRTRAGLPPPAAAAGHLPRRPSHGDRRARSGSSPSSSTDSRRWPTDPRPCSGIGSVPTCGSAWTSAPRGSRSTRREGARGWAPRFTGLARRGPAPLPVGRGRGTRSGGSQRLHHRAVGRLRLGDHGLAPDARAAGAGDGKPLPQRAGARRRGVAAARGHGGVAGVRGGRSPGMAAATGDGRCSCN